MQNYKKTIISQYGNSPRILAMIQTMQDSIGPAADIDGFFNIAFNVETAQGFGLDIWGRIVGVDRALKIQPASQYLGFDEGQTIAANDYQPFGSGIFYTSPDSGSIVLSDEAYRVLIFVKALSNISDGSPLSYNKLLRILFNQKVYCRETGPFSAEYVFESPLLPYELAILTNGTVIPRPAGVSISLA